MTNDVFSGWDRAHDLEYSSFKDVKQDDPKWSEYQTKLFQAFLNFVDEEKSKKSGILEDDVPEAQRERQLLDIIQKLPGIPAQLYSDLVKQLLDDIYRMGPAQPLWEKKNVSDIQIFVPQDNSEKQIITYMEGKRKTYTGKGFRDFEHARNWVNHHLSRIGLRFDLAAVQMDGTFPNGERIHIIFGPCGYSTDKNGEYKFVRCMIITIRRFVASFTLESLTEKSEMTYELPSISVANPYNELSFKRRSVYAQRSNQGGGMADRATVAFLEIMIALGKNHIVCGGTGTGKTTLANALTGKIPSSEVLLILEESPEMQPQRESGCIRVYERKESNFRLEDALKGALRMFPDRIFVAELRDQIAYVFLQAVQSGHDGSSTTVHASSCLSGVDRIIDMAAGHNSAPDRELLRNIIFDRVDTILHASREGGERFFDEIIQLRPDGTTHTVMRFVQVGVNDSQDPVGYFEFNGPTDEFVEEMIRMGYGIPESWGWEVEARGYVE
ncbi:MULTISPECIES: ATPase, T2SS/T4P/T4SS family [unclassified Paenibacillus]|uniref:ATPase, T2SS/T4P/T4SS family n=1 Tax=unclassified Paenibacillus TaxID=185978 RepID=UPI00020D762E|nr:MULTISPECIES: ATPase, T2SS/T4P/T4SS family [unclassified Paenibacillus]EGL15070.1 type II/IV secretion system protein [Paenibacillus sp. HGF7]EPD80460.1 hypothetical protein HMPREF1207_05675 [Paenibacillus sp. HGH0039]